MICRQIDTSERYSPVPISFLIKTANGFDCDIFLKCNNNHVNVKCYDEMLQNLRTCTRTLIFFFNGTDEQAAEARIERIFKEN